MDARIAVVAVVVAVVLVVVLYFGPWSHTGNSRDRGGDSGEGHH
jgi:hypothetical protein